MKILQTSFESNVDGMGKFKFEQIKRNDKVALYRRSKMDGTFHSFEVFEVKTIKAGAGLPGGLKVDEDYERYVTASMGGKLARFISDQTEELALVRAEKTFKEIQAVIDHRTESVEEGVTVDGEPRKKMGRARIERPDVIYPQVKQWTMKDLVAANPKWSQPLLYIGVIKIGKTSGIIKEVGEVPKTGQRGKAAKLYEKV